MNTSKLYLGAILISAAVLLFWVLVLPTYDSISGLRDALDQRSEILQQRTDTINKIKNLESTYNSRSSDLQRLSSVLPATKSAPEIVSTIQAMASQNGLTLVGLTLPANQSLAGDAYNTQTIEINLAGSYLAFRSFLNSIEHNLRVLDVATIEINSGIDNTGKLNFRIKAFAYYLK